MPHRHYTQLSYEERVLIEDWNKSIAQNKLSLRQFAEHLGRNPSTISRELQRNGRPPTSSRKRVNKPRSNGHSVRGRIAAEKCIIANDRYWKRYVSFLIQSRIHYTAKTAQRATLNRVKQPGLKLEQPKYEELLSFVITALDSRWSPEQISGRIELEGLLPNISHESIYSFIRKHKALQDLDLTSCLRRKGKRYHKRVVTTYNYTDSRRNISKRPIAVDNLIRIGDLEGDTIVSKNRSDRLLTHNDRKSGKVAIGKVLKYTAERISEQTKLDIERVFAGCCHTITYDNGSEFALWLRTEKDLDQLGTKIYFANAYHSWERGRNENINGLIRDFLPKGTDFEAISNDDILTIESLLNDRPRKRLKWLTPNEYYELYVRRTNVALEG